MGLFGKKKETKGVKISDVFSLEDLQTIKGTIEPKLNGGQYKALPQTLAKGLMDYVGNPEKEFSPNKMKGLAKIAVSFKEIEPSLGPVLQKGIEKIKAL